LGASLISGADSAMLYDSLQAIQRKNDYLKLEGRMTSIGNFAEAIAGVFGGLLATYSLRYPYIGQTMVAFIAIPAALTLIEPAREKAMQKMTFKDILQIFNYALIKKPKLRYNIMFSAIIGSSTLSMAWFVQPYFKEVDMPLSLYGILWTLLNLSVGLTSLFAYKIEEHLGKTSSSSLLGHKLFVFVLFDSGFCYPYIKGLHKPYDGKQCKGYGFIGS